MLSQTNGTGDISGTSEYTDEPVGGSDTIENGLTTSSIYSGIRLAYYKECLCAVKTLIHQNPAVANDGMMGLSVNTGLLLTRQDHVELINVSSPNLVFLLLQSYAYLAICVPVTDSQYMFNYRGTLLYILGKVFNSKIDLKMQVITRQGSGKTNPVQITSPICASSWSSH